MVTTAALIFACSLNVHFRQVFEISVAGLYYEVKGGCAGLGVDRARTALEAAATRGDLSDYQKSLTLANSTIHLMISTGENEKEDLESGRDRDTSRGPEMYAKSRIGSMLSQKKPITITIPDTRQTGGV